MLVAVIGGDLKIAELKNDAKEILYLVSDTRRKF